MQDTDELMQASSISKQARLAVENYQPHQVSLVRSFMKWLRNELDKLNPNFSREDVADELLVQAIEETKELVVEFAHLAESIATMNNSEAAQSLYKNFELIFERYNLPTNFSGSYQTIDFDFYKFIGHELFVKLF